MATSTALLRFHMPRRRAALGFSLACATILSVLPRGADADPVTMMGRVGQSPIDIVRSAQAQASAAALRAQWLANHTNVPAANALALTSGNVVANTITVGNPQSYPIIQFGFTGDVAGFAEASFVFTSPSGAQSYAASYVVGGYKTQGSAQFASVNPISLAAQPGTWTLSSATIYDYAGNSLGYTAAQLAPLFKNTSFTVVNTGPADTVTPTVISGKVLTKTVSLSSAIPAFQTTITASDVGGAGLYNEYVFISPPGFTFAFAGIYPLATPKTQGTVTTSDPLAGYGGAGIWGIYGYVVCDFESNCTQSAQPSDVHKLFGTNTFTVTQ